MNVYMVSWVVGPGLAYLSLDLLFSLAIVSAGVARIDPAARCTPWPARLLLVPGAALLWQLMLFKWVARRAPPEA